MRSVRAELERRLPPRVTSALRALRHRFREKRYFGQRLIKLKCGAYEIEAPQHHSLIQILTSWPKRDLCVGIAAQHISRKYPAGTIVDIGANIGDTAAIIATYSSNKLILVEGSRYFFEILRRNAAQFPNQTELKNALVSDGSVVSGDFGHWGGTASFREATEGRLTTKTRRLDEICAQDTCFIKIDTDGYDFRILTAGLSWLQRTRPAVLFEDQIRDEQDLHTVNELLERFVEIGYKYFLVWDNPGFHMLSTTSHQVLQDLNRYLLRVWQHPGSTSITNYDILCLQERDADLYEDLSEWWKTH